MGLESYLLFEKKTYKAAKFNIGNIGRIDI